MTDRNWMNEITVSGDTYEDALAEGLRQLGVAEEVVEVEVMSQAHDDTLPGAEPLPGVSLRLRPREDLLVQQAKDHLKRILELIGLEPRIEVMRRSRGIVFNILAGEDGALIIGRNGQNLDALEYLVRRMIVKSGRDLIPIIVDSEGYKEKRISRLEDIAKRCASRAIRQQQEIALEPMSASERKVIHMALKEMRGIHTISRGEESERHIVICPAGGESARYSPRRTERAG